MSGVGAKSLFLILMMSVFASIVSPQGAELSTDWENHANGPPTATDSTHTDHGNGSATDSFFVGPAGDSGIQDTWLSAAQTTTNYGTDDELRVGFSSSSSSRWNTMFGIDLAQSGFHDNVTITQATLALNVKQANGTPTVRSWVAYDETWEANTTTWGDWAVGGALGNQDSGGLMDEVTLLNNSPWLELDITRALNTAHYRYRTGMDPSASILLTGAAWGEEWVVFRSSEYVFASERPRLNITYTWGVSTPSTSIAWVDVFPKTPHRIDADNQLTLSAQARSGRGDTLAATPVWSANSGAIDGGGLFTPDIAGVVTIEAEIGGVVGSLPLQVTPGAPATLELVSKTLELTIDDSHQFNFTFVDAHGNSIVDSALTWYADKGTVNETGFYEPAQVGGDVVTVMWQNLYATAVVTVSAGSATNISFEENLTVASGQQIPLIYSVTDRLGNPLPPTAAGSIQWETESGQVDGVGVYTGDAVGMWRVFANATSGAKGFADIEVTAGALSTIELVVPNGSQPADMAVPLTVNWLDVMGNVVAVRIPISNWTAEDGNFRMTPAGVEWIPRREGVWQVSVHVEDEWANASITVVHGSVDSILVSSVSTQISADAVIELVTLAEDSKGNRWQVDSIWEAMEPVATPSLSQTSEGVYFSGATVGNWTVRAVHIDGNNSFTQFLTIEVVSGSLASISLAGNGMQVSADGYHDFAVEMYDEDGNMIHGVLANWSFEHDGSSLDRTGEIRDNGGVWYPSRAGHHEISVEAAGVYASIGMDVTPGIAHTLEVLPPQGVAVKSGEVAQFEVRASDLDGNVFGTDVVWDIPYGAVDLTNGTRAGEYLVRGVVAGTHRLSYSSGLADGSMSVVVQVGDVVAVEVVPERIEVKTGEVIEIELRGYDYGGNRVEVNPDDVTITSSAGIIGHSSGGYWNIYLKNSGDQQKVTATYNSAGGEAFLDVSPDPFRAFGDSNLATSLWAGIAVVTTLFLLLIIILRRRSVEERLRHEALREREKESDAWKMDLMAGYRPSKRTRKRMRANRQTTGLPSQSGWQGYQQAQQAYMNPSNTIQSGNEPNSAALHPAVVGGHQPAESPQSSNFTPVPTEQFTKETRIDDEREDVGPERATTEQEVEKPPRETWTTEQVWAWGRSQGWSDEQIASYEQVYDQSVRNPSADASTPSGTTTGQSNDSDYQVGQVGQTGLAGQASQTGLAGQASQTGLAGQASQTGQASEAVPTKGTDLAGQADQTGLAGQADQADQTAETSARSRAGGSTDVGERVVMKAMPGTTQGEAGWYLDGAGNPSRWEIDDDGTWQRTG